MAYKIPQSSYFSNVIELNTEADIQTFMGDDAFINYEGIIENGSYTFNTHLTMNSNRSIRFLGNPTFTFNSVGPRANIHISASGIDNSFTDDANGNSFQYAEVGDILMSSGWTAPAVANNTSFIIQTKVSSNKVIVTTAVTTKAAGDSVTLVTDKTWRSWTAADATRIYDQTDATIYWNTNKFTKVDGATNFPTVTTDWRIALLDMIFTCQAGVSETDITPTITPVTVDDFDTVGEKKYFALFQPTSNVKMRGKINVVGGTNYTYGKLLKMYGLVDCNFSQCLITLSKPWDATYDSIAWWQAGYNVRYNLAFANQSSTNNGSCTLNAVYNLFKLEEKVNAYNCRLIPSTPGDYWYTIFSHWRSAYITTNPGRCNTIFHQETGKFAGIRCFDFNGYYYPTIIGGSSNIKRTSATGDINTLGFADGGGASYRNTVGYIGTITG